MSSLPTHLEIPSAWKGPELAASPEKWSFKFSRRETDEVFSAARRYVDGVGDLKDISPRNFPLPLLGPRLVRLRAKLLHGPGFYLVRGIPLRGLAKEEIETMFAGIGSYIGSARPQNAAGDLLGHVIDTGASSIDPDTRIYQTNERQTFHTDSADVVGLLCLKQAQEGGDSLLVSAATIYNEISTNAPDLLPYLFDKIATDRRGEIPRGAKPYFRIPVLSWHKGFLTVMYQRQYIDSAQRFAEAPRLTSKHIEALDLFDTLANDPRLHLRMELERGDLQFVYNHGLLHDRTSFTDWPETGKRRHLLRLWLSVPGDRPLPGYFAERYGSIEVGNRGGVGL